MKFTQYFFMLAFVCASTLAFAQSNSTFLNPVIRGDVADPSLIQIGDTFYASGTSSEWAPYYPVFASKDLVNWKQTGHIFEEQPHWTSQSFWAPELFYHNGTVFCYYTARRASDGISCIGVASSQSPDKAFTDHGVLVDWGKEAIDAFVFDDNGQLYITWKAYGLDKRPIELLGCKLSADGLHLEGEPFSLLVDDQRIGMEGQYIFKKDGFYYLIYSAHSCCGFNSNYDVYVARATRFEGPYERFEGNPILHAGNSQFISCGHGTGVQLQDGRRFYLCHAYVAGDGRFAGRQPILQEFTVNKQQWVEFLPSEIAAASLPVPFKGTRQKAAQPFEDHFKNNKLNVAWTWNYPYSNINVHCQSGQLVLSGTPKGDGNEGTVLCLRAERPDYAFETAVTNQNESLKGLTYYGDGRNYIVWGVQGDKLLIKQVSRRSDKVLYEAPCTFPTPHFKIEIHQGRYISFSFSSKGKKWISALEIPLDQESTTLWDRVARPGCIHIGHADAPARFSYFKLTPLS